MVHNLAFVLVISSVILADFDGLFEACRFFVVLILDVFLKLLAVFVGCLRSFSLFLLVVFLLFLLAVSEAFCCF